MAEEFLTLMADLDDDAQARMSAWYDALKEAGFTGTQTPGLPFHISLATFPLEKEREAAELTKQAGEAFSRTPVQISHMGLFAGGRVLFCGPERNPRPPPPCHVHGRSDKSRASSRPPRPCRGSRGTGRAR